MDKTITADDGTMYKVVELTVAGDGSLSEPTFTLKPVVVKDTPLPYEIHLTRYIDDKHHLFQELKLTEPQATALAAAIKALVEYVQCKPQNFPEVDQHYFVIKARYARNALMEQS